MFEIELKRVSRRSFIDDLKIMSFYFSDLTRVFRLAFSDEMDNVEPTTSIGHTRGTNTICKSIKRDPLQCLLKLILCIPILNTW